MLLTLIIASIATNICIIAGGYYVYHRSISRYASISAAVLEYFTATDPQGVTGFGELVDTIAQNFASKIGTVVQASIRGSISGSTRALVPVLEQEAVEGNPELGIMSVLPKSLKKNPIAMAGLQMLISRMINKQNGGQEAISGGGQAKFNL